MRDGFLLITIQSLELLWTFKAHGENPACRFIYSIVGVQTTTTVGVLESTLRSSWIYVSVSVIESFHTVLQVVISTSAKSHIVQLYQVVQVVPGIIPGRELLIWTYDERCYSASTGVQLVVQSSSWTNYTSTVPGDSAKRVAKWGV